jgi:uncharacterized protein (UPF0332 family)
VTSDDLLEQARNLLALDPRRPREINLRRAVSASYYALFHEICKQAADSFVGVTKHDRPAWGVVYRSLQHGQAKERCKALAGKGLGQQVDNIASQFPTLQAERHTADYDPSGFAKGRVEVESLIADAQSAIADLRDMPNETKLDFLARLLFSERR